MLDADTNHEDDAGGGGPPLHIEASIRKDLITNAVAAQEALQSRLDEAQTGLADATTALGEADKSLANYVADVASGTKKADVGQMAALGAAQTRVAFQARLVAEVEKQLAAAKGATKQAIADAHRPMYDLGRQVRLEAARAADKARASLAAAERQFRQGTSIITSATSRGARHPGNELSISLSPVPHHGVSVREGTTANAAEARELAFWAGVEGEA